MRVREAKERARQWVRETGALTPGFQGAYLAGSVNWMQDDDELPASSDVDVMVVVRGDAPAAKLGKFIFRGALLEVSYLPKTRIASARTVLDDYHLAAGISTTTILLDPSGDLAALQLQVARDYAKRDWVRRRCDQAGQNVLRWVEASGPETSLHDRVTHCLFAAGVTTHVLLVAGLRNPTVRDRYSAVREVLRDHGRLDFYESFLRVLGASEMDRKRATAHLQTVREMFDAAVLVMETPFPFAADISEAGRPAAIGGSEALIASGNHREALFWIAATAARCRGVLERDASREDRARFDPPFRALLDDLGIGSESDRRARREEVRAFLPRVQDVAEAIMTASPDVSD
jgi:hypothetical protein